MEQEINGDLIDRIAAYDPELAEETAHALRARRLADNVDRAKASLSRLCSRSHYEDPTGQDMEDEIDQAAHCLVNARDELMKHQDPEQYAERMFGA